MFIREEFRRDGLAAMHLVDKRLMHLVDNSMSGHKINIGYPSICQSEFQRCKNILRSSHYNEYCVVGHARTDHVIELADVLQGTHNSSANVWFPVSDWLAEKSFSAGAEGSFDLLKGAVNEFQHNSSKPFDVALVDCSRDELGIAERAKDWSLALWEMGVRNIILCDTIGTMNPETLQRFLNTFPLNLRDRLELHLHDTNGFAYENSIVGYNSGVQYFGTSLFQASERGDLLDSRIILGDRMNSECITRFEALFAKQFNKTPYDCVQEVYRGGVIITGSQYRVINSSLNQSVAFGVTSNSCILNKMLGIKSVRRGLLSEIKDYMYHKKVLYLNNQELREVIDTIGF